MASRDITNMHLFLEMKKKFPALPEDTLREYIFLFAKDKAKCSDLLHKKQQNLIHQSQPFAEFHQELPMKKEDYQKSPRVPPKNGASVHTTIAPNIQIADNIVHSPESSVKSSVFCDQNTQGCIIKIPEEYINPSKTKVSSAPVMSNQVRPFFDDGSSHMPFHRSLPDDECKEKDYFMSIKEHTILPFNEQAERHTVRLSIVPSFPFQQLDTANNSTATKCHSPEKTHHRSSVSLQVKPCVVNQNPFEIVGSSHGLGSHVKISFESNPMFVARPIKQSSQYHFSESSQVGNSKKHAFPMKLNYAVQNSLSDVTDTIDNAHGKESATAFYPAIPQEVYSSKIKVPFISDRQNQLTESYTEAVIKHQLVRMDLISQELNKEKITCAQLNSEISRMELDVSQMRLHKKSFPYMKELQKLREENRSLRVECNCLLIEVDMCNTRQIPLGMTDEDFYANIFTGPNGKITSNVLEKDKSATQNNERAASPPKKISQAKEEDDNDEKNSWKCKNCTFVNHPALQICELCELPKNPGHVEYRSINSGEKLSFSFSPRGHGTTQPHRVPGSVQISVRHKMPSSQSVQLQVVHRRIA